jgi:hypothetical protein
LVIAEWNLNFSDNILRLGNYRNRPSLTTKTEANFGTIASTYDTNDALLAYTGATDSNIVVNTGLNSSTSSPTTFMTKNETEKILYSLSDCISRFRPRSGINKFRFFSGSKTYLNFENENMYLKPRYYSSSKDDKFKYWNSYRIEGSKYTTSIAPITTNVVATQYTLTLSSTTGLSVGQTLTQTSTPPGALGSNPTIVSIDSNTQITLSVAHITDGSVTFTVNDYTPVEKGIARTFKSTGEYYIEDTAPFVVYDKLVPTNRIVVKMQTQSSDYNDGSFKLSNNTSLNDPFYEDPANTGALVNQRTPEDWKIQYLDSTNVWQEAKVFTSSSTRLTGKRIIGSDGYVELAYGITNTLPEGFRDLGQYPSLESLPVSADTGDAYLVPGTGAGTYYVWNGTNWTTNSFVPTYGWYLNEEGQILQTSNVTSLTSPDFYGTPTTVYNATYREFQFIKGIRIVVNTMSKENSMFELIEMSPRLVANLSDRTKEYSVSKIASDIGNTGIPVGQLSASTGSITLFDYDQSLNPYNTLRLSSGLIAGSILCDISSKNLQFKLYEQIIDNRTSTIADYFVPIKTMYVDGFPDIKNDDRSATLELRDLFFYFESTIAPSLLMRNVKLSKAISTMLDNIGFSNYKFYRNADEKDDVIPYFYIAPDTTVSDVLNDLAQSTQTAMFFDEDNNFIAMSRNYIMPTVAQRATDIKLYAIKDFNRVGVEKNKATNQILANVMSVSSENNEIFNSGKVTYSNKYIQKSYGTIKEASLLNNNQSYKYKPVLLWEVSGTDVLRPTNEEVGNQSSYVLSALPLNSTIKNVLPTVSNGVIINNIMDFGQSIYWLTRYEGYLYANGEIIKYKGVEHTLQGSLVSGLEATLSNGVKTFTLTKGNIYSLSVGQRLTKNVGDTSPGTFGPTCIITGIDKNKKIITVSVDNATSGAIVFSAQPNTANVWIEDVNDYQKYFAQVGFNGKLFPTGRVKIYAEPDYNTDGTVKEGAVAKHGRMQFGTGVYDPVLKSLAPATHSILDSSNEWLLASRQNAFAMDSKWMLKDNHKYTQTKYTITAATGAAAQKTITLTTGTTGKIQVGWLVSATAGVANGSVVATVAEDKKSFTVDKNLTGSGVSGQTITVIDRVVETLYNTGNAITSLTKKPTVDTTIKDMFDSSYFTESSSTVTQDKSKPNGSTKSSALILTGVPNKNGNSNDYLSYVYKDYSSSVPNANIFGTRMRILGKAKSKNKEISSINQIAIGADIVNTIANDTGSYIISGTGGGIAINLGINKTKNVGYYFEIMALSNESILEETGSNKTIDTIPNVYFYKILRNGANKAIPVTLWYGTAPILVDDGLFPGMAKTITEANPTVYDLSIKTEQISSTETKFYLYLNNKLITTVVDTDAIPVTENNKNMALFVRGGGRSMFEHVYAIQDNKISQYETSNSPLSKFLNAKDSKFKSDSYRKYLISPTVIESYLNGVSANGQKKQEMYYEEFGTVMRECAYFNVRYDKAYPALYSKISPTFNDQQGYLVSGYRANPYGAEFLVFNVTDFALSLDETSGNYLRIQGITFTQQSSHDLTVDEYFTNASSLNNYNNYTKLNSKYVDIQNSRNTYGKHDFTITGTYIQNIDTANKLMEWMVDKVMVPKKSICVEIFANPMIQLGDIVTIDYSIDNVQQLPNSRFVVYHIEYSRGSNGPSMTLYLSEVV